MPIGKTDPETKEAIQVLIDCARECRHCTQACQDEEESAALEECIRLSEDCAEICALGADLLRRRSPFGPRLRALCAEVCEACAEACARRPGLEQCRECGEACLRCAAICRDRTGTAA